MKTDEEMENMKRRLKDWKIPLTKFVIYLIGIPEKKWKNRENPEEQIFKITTTGTIIQ